MLTDTSEGQFRLKGGVRSTVRVEDFDLRRETVADVRVVAGLGYALVPPSTRSHPSARNA
jgi:hypothetical protein